LFFACSEKSITKFATGLVDGSVEPEYKSAPIPDEPTDGGVTVVVGKNFDSIVKDKTKDVLLEVSTIQVVLWCALQVAGDALQAMLTDGLNRLSLGRRQGHKSEHP
jgi:hypothetical protein